MKKYILFILLLAFSFTGFAQNGSDSTGDNSVPSFTEPIPNTVPYFELREANIPAELRQYLGTKLREYSIYDFRFEELRSYLDNNMYALEFNIGHTFFSLQRRDIRSPEFTQTETREDGRTVITHRQDLDGDSTYEVHFVKGLADRENGKIVRFSIEPDDLTGYIWNTETNQVLYYTSLKSFVQSNGDKATTDANYLLVFELGALIEDKNALCGAVDKIANPAGDPQAKGFFDKCTPRFLEIAAEGDKWWCDAFGASATSKILQNLFLVEGIYTQNFNIQFVINNINLLPGNPLYNTNNSNAKISQFQSNWNANHTGIKRDIAILYTGTSYLNGVIGNAYPNTICNIYGAYATMSNHSKNVLICAHELGHVFGSLHDDDSYDQNGNLVPGYHTSSCSGSDKPIMCSYAVANGPYYYFSSYTRNIILNSINSHSACLSDHVNSSPTSTILKTWTNYQNQRWIATWLLQNGDQKVVGNFDGENGDDEIFFAAPDNKWVGIMDFSCDQGTDWYHMWGNSGNGSFGTWIRNSGDKYMAGDFDGNGKADLFSVSGSAYWSALQEYNPSGWSWIHKWGNAGTRWIASWYINKNDTYTIGDFDGDGRDELLCVNPNGWSQIIKFNWNGSYYTPQTIWSNGGNGWVGGVQIGNTNRWLKGKFTQTSRDELFTISGTWVTTQRFNGSSWQWIWSQYGANNFASMYILPLNNDQKVMTGNFDADPRDEFVNVNKTWAATADYNGSTYVQNWNNGGNNMLSDWNLNIDGEYLLVKAAQTDPKQILGIRYEKRTSGWWLWKKEWWEPNLCGMYKGNAAFQNFRVIPDGRNASATTEEHVLRVYPNPTNDAVKIDFDKQTQNAIVSITDMTGKQLSSQTITPSDNTISLKDLPSGMYILQAVFPDHTSLTSKISVYGK